jgi:hypothetical protein
MADEKTWEGLFQQALRLLDEIHIHGTKHLYWTFGGGTVLMRKYRHRLSKDIDIFVPDPQALNYVNPRLSQVAEEISMHYEEANGYVKLFLQHGEIDFVASPNLTAHPCVDEKYLAVPFMWKRQPKPLPKSFFIAVTDCLPATCSTLHSWQKMKGPNF